MKHRPVSCVLHNHIVFFAEVSGTSTRFMARHSFEARYTIEATTTRSQPSAATHRRVHVADVGLRLWRAVEGRACMVCAHHAYTYVYVPPSCSQCTCAMDCARRSARGSVLAGRRAAAPAAVRLPSRPLSCYRLVAHQSPWKRASRGSVSEIVTAPLQCICSAACTDCVS